MFTLGQIPERQYKFQQLTTECFIEFCVAVDFVDGQSFRSILRWEGMSEKHIILSRAYYLSTLAVDCAYGKESPELPADSGVR